MMRWEEDLFGILFQKYPKNGKASSFFTDLEVEMLLITNLVILCRYIHYFQSYVLRKMTEQKIQQSGKIWLEYIFAYNSDI